MIAYLALAAQTTWFFNKRSTGWGAQNPARRSTKYLSSRSLSPSGRFLVFREESNLPGWALMSVWGKTALMPHSSCIPGAQFWEFHWPTSHFTALSLCCLLPLLSLNLSSIQGSLIPAWTGTLQTGNFSLSMWSISSRISKQERRWQLSSQ